MDSPGKGYGNCRLQTDCDDRAANASGKISPRTLSVLSLRLSPEQKAVSRGLVPLPIAPYPLPAGFGVRLQDPRAAIHVPVDVNTVR